MAYVRHNQAEVALVAAAWTLPRVALFGVLRYVFHVKQRACRRGLLECLFHVKQCEAGPAVSRLPLQLG